MVEKTFFWSFRSTNQIKSNRGGGWGFKEEGKTVLTAHVALPLPTFSLQKEAGARHECAARVVCESRCFSVTHSKKNIENS